MLSYCGLSIFLLYREVDYVAEVEVSDIIVHSFYELVYLYFWLLVTELSF